MLCDNISGGKMKIFREIIGAIFAFLGLGLIIWQFLGDLHLLQDIFGGNVPLPNGDNTGIAFRMYMATFEVFITWLGCKIGQFQRLFDKI